MIWFSIMIVITLLIPGCTPPQRPVLGFNPQLSISEPPVLGKPVKLTLTFNGSNIKGVEDKEPYYFARIEFTPGVYEVIDGYLEQLRENIPGEQYQLEVTIKSIRTTGSGEIYGHVAMVFPPDVVGGEGDYDVLFITISEDGAKVIETQPNLFLSCQ